MEGELSLFKYSSSSKGRYTYKEKTLIASLSLLDKLTITPVVKNNGAEFEILGTDDEKLLSIECLYIYTTIGKAIQHFKTAANEILISFIILGDGALFIYSSLESISSPFVGTRGMYVKGSPLKDPKFLAKFLTGTDTTKFLSYITNAHIAITGDTGENEFYYISHSKHC